jgi:hypothetical protein
MQFQDDINILINKTNTKIESIKDTDTLGYYQYLLSCLNFLAEGYELSAAEHLDLTKSTDTDINQFCEKYKENIAVHQRRHSFRY